MTVTWAASHSAISASIHRYTRICDNSNTDDQVRLQPSHLNQSLNSVTPTKDRRVLTAVMVSGTGAVVNAFVPPAAVSTPRFSATRSLHYPPEATAAIFRPCAGKSFFQHRLPWRFHRPTCCSGADARGSAPPMRRVDARLRIGSCCKTATEDVY
jgi:hypothetical protein